jgi:hypothetical protein
VGKSLANHPELPRARNPAAAKPTLHCALELSKKSGCPAVRGAIAGTVRAIAGGTFSFAALMAWYSIGDPVSIDNVARAHWRKALLPSRR